MEVRRLWLTQFRNYRTAEVTFAPGLTAVLGPNGRGKTNLLEALAWLASLRSFRGSPNEALVRQGAERAVIRADVDREGRQLLIEAELAPSGRNRVQINRQRLGRAKDLLGALRVSVFSPDDLVLVKGGPAERRRFLDDTLVAIHPRHDAVQSEVERLLRQRNALLRQVSGRLDDSSAFTLDVWDAKLAEAGEALVLARSELLARLAPTVEVAYAAVAGAAVSVRATYEAPWQATGLATALAQARTTDLRRGVTTVGPHRDEVLLGLAGMPARTHASQGEQRCLALALRLAAHDLVAVVTGTPPVLLLDDVFSELDASRANALLGQLPRCQTILTSAAGLPKGAVPDKVLLLDESGIREAA
ncbi:MAG: DNA replication/repair protein RecF [Acidimicrobiales bacterium]